MSSAPVAVRGEPTDMPSERAMLLLTLGEDDKYRALCRRAAPVHMNALPAEKDYPMLRYLIYGPKALESLDRPLQMLERTVALLPTFQEGPLRLHRPSLPRRTLCRRSRPSGTIRQQAQRRVGSPRVRVQAFRRDVLRPLEPSRKGPRIPRSSPANPQTNPLPRLALAPRSRPVGKGSE